MSRLLRIGWDDLRSDRGGLGIVPSCAAAASLPFVAALVSGSFPSDLGGLGGATLPLGLSWVAAGGTAPWQVTRQDATLRPGAWFLRLVLVGVICVLGAVGAGAMAWCDVLRPIGRQSIGMVAHLFLLLIYAFSAAIILVSARWHWKHDRVDGDPFAAGG